MAVVQDCGALLPPADEAASVAQVNARRPIKSNNYGCQSTGKVPIHHNNMNVAVLDCRQGQCKYLFAEFGICGGISSAWRFHAR